MHVCICTCTSHCRNDAPYLIQLLLHNYIMGFIIPTANVHILDGNALDLVKECDAFEKQIKDAGGVHLFIGGI